MRQNAVVQYLKKRGQLTIRIRHKVKPGLLLLRAFFLAGWTLGCLMLPVFISRGFVQNKVFDILIGIFFVFLFLWTEYITVLFLFWPLFGREIISVKKGMVSIRSSVLGIGRELEFVAKEMKNFKTLSHKTKPAIMYFNFFQGPEIKGGRIYFEYRGKPYRFCRMMFEDEATDVLVELHKYMYKL